MKEPVEMCEELCIEIGSLDVEIGRCCFIGESFLNECLRLVRVSCDIGTIFISEDVSRTSD